MSRKLFLLTFTFGIPLFGQPSLSPVLQAMKAELSHSMDALKSQKNPTYFLSYSITDQKRTLIRANFGSLEYSNSTHTRNFALDLRVGDYNFDNTHEVRGEFGSFASRTSFAQIPIEDDVDAIRTIIWLETDKRYKRAVEELTRVKTNKAVKVKEEDTSDDFSHEQPHVFTEEPLNIEVDKQMWEAKLKKYTALFRSHPNLYDGIGSFEVLVETKYFVSSEGTVLQTSNPYVRLFLSGMGKADDGMELRRYQDFFGFTPDKIPADDVVMAKIESMIDDLEKLRVAPIVDPYTGPAILEGGAPGVFFHEVLGHRAEGHRQKSEAEGQTFKKKLGEKILPDAISVIFDPTIDHTGNVDLSGYYKYDEQGVPSQRVVIVDHGVFRNFLMARSPIEGFLTSNGHGRAQAGFQPVSRQSNLFVETTSPVPAAQLRQMLIDDCKKKNKPYGLIFSQIEGGFTLTGRVIPNAFNVLPLVVHRVYTDGRPDELVRGVDLVGTPLTALSKIVAAGDNPETWYGYCGAESGGVPVSQTCPSILISEIEVQKKSKSQEQPPVLAPPSDKKAN